MDKEHGAVLVHSVEPVAGKNYDKVVVEKNGSVYDGRGQRHTLFLGSRGAAGRLAPGSKVSEPFTRHAPRKYTPKPKPVRDDPDAYDRMRDYHPNYKFRKGR